LSDSDRWPHLGARHRGPARARWYRTSLPHPHRRRRRLCPMLWPHGAGYAGLFDHTTRRPTTPADQSAARPTTPVRGV